MPSEEREESESSTWEHAEKISGVVIRENRILSIIHDVLIMYTLVFNDRLPEILPSHYKVDLINGYQTQDTLFCKASEEMTGSACGVKHGLWSQEDHVEAFGCDFVENFPILLA